MLVIKQNNLRLRCVYTLSLIKKKEVRMSELLHLFVFARVCVYVCIHARVWGAFVCMRASACVCMCVCVCVCEKERENACVCVCV